MLFWNGLTGHYLNIIMNLSSPANASALQCLVCDGNFHRGDNLVPAWRAEIMQVMHDRRRLCACLVSTPSVHRSMTPITAVIFVKGKRNGIKVNFDLLCVGSRALQNLLTPSCCILTGEAGTARSELSCTQGFDSVLGFYMCGVHHLLPCSVYRAVKPRGRRLTGTHSLAPLFPPKRNPFHRE